MLKSTFLVSVSAVLMLHGAENLKLNKQDGTNQMYNLSTVTEINFIDPATSKLKFIKKDGSQVVFNLSDITKLTFSELNDIEKAEVLKKLGISLVRNYPNPFNPTTMINFTTSKEGITKVEVFNQAGQLVSMLHNANLTVGNHEIQWNAQNASAGTYFIKVSQNSEVVSSKMLLVK